MQQFDLTGYVHVAAQRHLKLLLDQALLKIFAAWSLAELLTMLLSMSERCTALATLFQALNLLSSLTIFYLSCNTGQKM